MAVSQTVESFGTVRARAGVVFAPPLLLYAPAVRVRSRAEISACQPAPPRIDRGQLLLCLRHRHGLFRRLGIANLVRMECRAGAEYAITTNLIFRTELLYVHLSAPTVTVTATAVAAGTAPASFAAGFSSVYFAVMRGGLNYKF